MHDPDGRWTVVRSLSKVLGPDLRIAVVSGERYRFRSAPGIRITTATLEPGDAVQLADAIAVPGRAPSGTYAG